MSRTRGRLGFIERRFIRDRISDEGGRELEVVYIETETQNFNTKNFFIILIKIYTICPEKLYFI